MLAVLLMHYYVRVVSPANPQPDGLEVVWPWIIDQLQPIRMPLLLFLSGMLASSRLLGERRAPAAARGISSLYLNAVWTTIYFLVSFFFVVPASGQMNSIGEWALHLVVPGPNLWFVWALGFWALLFIVLRTLPPLLVLALFFFTGIFASQFYQLFPSSVLPVFLYGIYFALGVYGKDIAIAFFEKDVITKFIVLGVIFAAVHRVMQLGGLDPVIRSTMSNVRSVAGLSMEAAFFVIVCKWDAISRVLGFIGRRTLALFVCHLPLVWLVMNVDALRAILTPTGAEVLWPVFGVVFLAAGSLAFEWAARRVGARHLFDTPRWLLPPYSRKRDAPAASSS